MAEAGAYVVAALGLRQDVDHGAGGLQAAGQQCGEGVEARLVVAGRLLGHQQFDDVQHLGLAVSKIIE